MVVNKASRSWCDSRADISAYANETGHTYDDNASYAASKPQYDIVTVILTGNGTNDYEPHGVNQADIMAFKKNIPTTAGVDCGMNTIISFSPDGILGTAHFDPSTWCSPTVARIVATAVDASLASHLAADRMRLVPIPTHGYDMFKSIFPLLSHYYLGMRMRKCNGAS